MTANEPSQKICFVLTSPLALNAFLIDQLAQLCLKYSVTVYVNTREVPVSERLDARVQLRHIEIKRQISLWSDLLILIQLARLFRQERLKLVHSVTPKAGLLAMLAGLIVGVPHRIHTFTGQVWVTRQGLLRIFLRSMDWFLAKCATHLLADSESQRDFLIQQKVVVPEKVAVLAKGSISGVNIHRFKPDLSARQTLRQELGLSEQAVLFLYLGRFIKDKGVLDLARSFAYVAKARPNAHIVFIGPDEQQLTFSIKALTAAYQDRAMVCSPTKQPERYMAAADVYCLPSYREGFGTAIIEAAACGTPAIASKIYGITDAVVEGETGCLFPAGDVQALMNLMLDCCDHPEKWKMMGANGMQRAIRDFSAQQVTQALMSFYAHLLSS